MASPSVSERPIVSQPEFVIAARDTGYRSLAAAVAELVDNSIQAQASEVLVFVQGNEGQSQQLGPPIIAVWDNGAGMDEDGIATSVQFGGTERFNDRTGLGRFGMGLPNSSVSIARRVDVYSWKRAGLVWHTYLDIDEVARGGRLTIPQPTRHPLPGWAECGHGTQSGTLVVWSRCDRLDLKRPAAICQRLMRPLGRIYRRHIWSGLKILINRQHVDAFDPLYCRPDTHEGGASPYGEVLSYELATSSGGRAGVEVRFAELPVALWHSMTNDEKRRAGIAGGGGVSFMRAGREIDFGWHLMGAKRRENYDDWWRCEISFSPELDEYFGVTHSKQGVTPTAYLKAILEPDLEAVARCLNGRVRSAFAELMAHAPSRAAVRASTQDRLLPALANPRAGGSSVAKGLQYEIATSPIAGREFVRVSRDHDRVRLTLNQDHPFYQTLYRSLNESPERGHFAVECLLLAAARAGLEVHSEDENRRYIDCWSDALAAFLDARGNKL